MGQRLLCTYTELGRARPTGTPTNPWDEACRLFDMGDLPACELKAVALDLFGDIPHALNDALSEIAEYEGRPS